MYSYHRLPVTIVSLLTFISVLAFISLAWNAPALGAEPAETLVLVARPSPVSYTHLTLPTNREV